MVSPPRCDPTVPPPFASFWFDCDSTLATIEGVDELLRNGDGDLRRDVLALTERAMAGDLPLAEVYESRLSLIAPTRAMLGEVGSVYVRHLVPDAAQVVAALHFLGKKVGIVSGGLELPVRLLAKHLGIADGCVHAVPVLFDEQGNYRTFDRRSPLWRNGGKVEVLAALPVDCRPSLYVGDGITDLEAAEVVDRFVGFGGVAVRDKVKAAAPFWFETPGLAPVLRFGCSPAEGARLAAEPRFAELWARAQDE